ncbi:replication factor C large subunit [Candidatus Woesearchaeota archaeon]|nr:replication factor C large subunit [Candidatus Woesearchaeota archaeon]
MDKSAALPWTLKYQPKSLKEFTLYPTQIQQMQIFVQNFKKQKKKAMLLHGPTGCGKTVAVTALAKDSDLELIEINASDFRNKEGVLSIIGTAAKQRSLFSSGKIILVDEVDGLSGNQDRGGIGAIEEVIAQTAFPIFLTCQDASDKKIKSLLKISQAVAFTPLTHLEVTEILKQICKKENIQYDEMALKTLARQADGDLRGAINDLQSLGREKITMQHLEAIGFRNKEEAIEDALIKVFKVKDANVALRAFDNVQEDLDQIAMWIDESLPKEYTDPAALAAAYDAMSRADVFNGRIRRWQHWGFLVYVNALLSAGVAVAKTERNKEQISYQRTQRILKIWIAKQKYAKREGIAQKIAAKTHASSTYCVQHVVPYVKQMFKNKTMREQMISEFEFDADEIGWLGN